VIVVAVVGVVAVVVVVVVVLGLVVVTVEASTQYDQPTVRLQSVLDS
jgi:hypothetical protein